MPADMHNKFFPCKVRFSRGPACSVLPFYGNNIKLKPTNRENVSLDQFKMNKIVISDILILAPVKKTLKPIKTKASPKKVGGGKITKKPKSPGARKQL